MLDEIKNLKDSSKDSLKDTSSVPAPLVSPWQKHIGSYTKTNKLISALYMVTDIMDKEDPLRNKLRTLGVEMISDIHINPTQIENKIHEILSLLDIASTVNLVSEMNSSILKKEFIEMKQSIQDHYQNSHKTLSTTISEFFTEDHKEHQEMFITHKGHPVEYKGHALTRIGVQKGSTLMKALSDKTAGMSYGKFTSNHTPHEASGIRSGFDALKKERRTEIVDALKNNPEGLSIKDIASTLKNTTLSDKTLQRELVSMVKDNLLKKTGEKRWSRYFLPK